MPRPNLFAYATSELSQDAFLCWLLDWANKNNADNDSALQQAACIFLNALLAKHDRPPVSAPDVRIYRQAERADIVAVVNEHFVLAIEDKISAGIHGDQLNRYPDRIRKKFPGADILPIFLKTVEQSNYGDVEQAGYKLFLRSDALAALRTGAGGMTNAIFLDFLSKLEELEVSITSYGGAPVDQWVEERNPWIGFYSALQQRRTDLRWDYVANPAGGFLGAWWHSGQWNGCDVYLQIEQGPLCFKIAVEDTNGDHRRALRHSWFERLRATAQLLRHPHLSRPRRFGLGSWMTVAVVECANWMGTRVDGILDWELTMQNLTVNERVLDEAVRV